MLKDYLNMIVFGKSPVGKKLKYKTHIPVKQYSQEQNVTVLLQMYGPNGNTLMMPSTDARSMRAIGLSLRYGVNHE